jgi:hypothetical protein
MIAFRLVLIVTLITVTLATALYLLTGGSHWLRLAKGVGIVGGAVLLLYLLLFFIERLLAL